MCDDCASKRMVLVLSFTRVEEVQGTKCFCKLSSIDKSRMTEQRNNRKNHCSNKELVEKVRGYPTRNYCLVLRKCNTMLERWSV